MQHARPLAEESDLQFSTLTEEERADALLAERNADSVLFKVGPGEVANEAPPRPPLDQESSGLVDIKDLVGGEPVATAPEGSGIYRDRESSGLVDLSTIIAREAGNDPPPPAGAASTGAAPPVSLIDPPSAGFRPLVPPPSVAAPAPTRVPTGLLVAVIVTLLGAVATLLWKILAT